MNEPKREIVIKPNNLGVGAPCAICDAWVEPDVGAALFLEGTWDAVCYDCGKERASEMVKWVELIKETDRMGTYDPKWDVQDIEAVNKEQRKGWEAIHVTEQYYVRTVDVQTGEETISEPSPSESTAVDFAERLAAEFYGGDDVTWFEKVGDRYHVGRILEDGTRSEPLVRISVEEEEVDEEPV